ncbi:MAG: RNA polymerase sigma factor [Calditrichaeota bacterium]|nr:MAG: RNA polymerase sigma factor [Calditrichota bacterium]
MAEQRSDIDIMKQVRDGKINEMSRLYERHHLKLYHFFYHIVGNRQISEDLTQEVFLRMLRFRRSYKGNAPFVCWMFRIARNLSFDYFRSRRSLEPLDDVDAELISEEPNPFEQMHQKQEAQFLQSAIAQLPTLQREALIFSRFEGLPLKEIAEIQRCPVNTVKVRIHRAVKELSGIFMNMAGINQ